MRGLVLSLVFLISGAAVAADEFTSVERLLGAGRTVEAIDRLEAMIVAKPFSPEAYSLLGEAYLTLERPKQAEKYFLIALELEPTTPAVIAALGAIELQRNDIAGASARLERLSRVCGEGCVEYKELLAALSESQNAAP